MPLRDGQKYILTRDKNALLFPNFEEISKMQNKLFCGDVRSILLQIW